MNKYILLYEDFTINESLDNINENILKDIGSLTKDTLKLLVYKIIIQYKKLSYKAKKRWTKALVALLLAKGSIGLINKVLASDDIKNEIELCEDIIEEVEVSNFKIGYDFIVSDNGKEMIKKHEGYRDTAYRLKDGKITIGWGHAEPVYDSQFKVGDKISKERATELFNSDLTEAADGIRRIFKQWETQNINIIISQEMFDALVSLTYNAGIGNVRKSKFIQSIKKGDFEKAAKEIESFKINPNYEDGLRNRRMEEIDLFMSRLK